MRDATLLAVVLVISAAICYGGQEASEAAASEAPVFSLGEPEVAKIAWNARALTAHDIDRDGRNDLVLINNDRARIEVLYQRTPGDKVVRRRSTGSDRWTPQLEDARFRMESVASGIRMFDLVAGDVNGDGLPDLVYTGSPDALTVRFQKPKGEFSKRRVIDLEEPVGWTGTLMVADLDGDTRDDLAVLTEKELLVFTQAGGGELVGPRSYALSDEGCFGLRALDVNGDRSVDLLFQVANRPDALRVLFGQEGGFGAEQAFQVQAPRGLMEPIRLGGDNGLGFVLVEQNTGLLEVFTFEEKEDAGTLLRDIRPRLFSSRVDSKIAASYAVADLDGDSRSDIVIADPGGARVWVVLQTAAGVFAEAVAFPSLDGVRSISSGDADGDGAAELFLASPDERLVAVAGLSGQGRLSYPKPLPTTGKPYAVAAADFDADGMLDVAYAYEEKKDRGVVLLRRTDRESPWTATKLEVKGVRTTPRDLMAADANQDGRLDLLLFVAHEPVRLLVQGEDGGFVEADPSDGFNRGLLNNVSSSALSFGDVTGDGRPEMLVAGDGFARSLRLSSSGELEVVDQYNARETDVEIAAASVVDLDFDEVPEVVLVEAGGERMQVLVRGRDGVYRYRESVPVDGIDLVSSRVVDLTGNGRSDLLLFGKRRYSWWPVGARDLGAKVIATYESDLEDVGYHLLGVGDLNADGTSDIVTIDSRDSRVLEILSRNGKGEWRSALHFTIFEVDPHYEGQRGASLEPRSVIVSDLTGDGREDLAMLIHDRVLVYPQQVTGGEVGSQ